MQFIAENAVTVGLRKQITMSNIEQELENYYNNNDWRLFNPHNFDTVVNIEVKKFGGFDLDDRPSVDQVAFYIEKIKNLPY